MSSKIQVKAGNVKIGGGAEISVQSMLNVPSIDIEGSVKQAVELVAYLFNDMGCDLFNVSRTLKVAS